MAELNKDMENHTVPQVLTAENGKAEAKAGEALAQEDYLALLVAQAQQLNMGY